MLKRESNKSETLMRTANDGVHILDLEGNIIKVNDAFCRMLGYSSDELQGMNLSQIDAKRSADEIKIALANKGLSNPVLENTYYHRNGGITHLEISSSRVEIDGQQLIYNSARDITKRKQAEASLRESEARLHATIETAMDAVIQMDANGFIIGWNSQARKYLWLDCGGSDRASIA